ncbi:Ribbon-helix-helix protein, copG family [Micromonospora matsumotoense]|uniref:Ribbon-helix-helix protein, copG family n=2 Tax=Micromonospora matsumotoense TaxID=121616 RepID=A0A1C4ZUS3_9ACTN|nr:Ribbon-helix-helix protein, copG family [Micromonospora matsumotoense]
MTPSVVDQPTGELYNSGMAFTLNLKPEVEQRLKELAEAEHRSMHKTVEVAVQAYLDRHDRDEWTRQAARRVRERNAEFYEMLGDR